MSFGQAPADLRDGPPRDASDRRASDSTAPDRAASERTVSAGTAADRGSWPGRRPLFPPPARYRGSARFALGFAAGCTTVLPWAEYLSFRDAHPPAHAGAYYGLGIAAKVGACALVTLPASGIVLALMQLRHAFTVASAGWALSMMWSMLLSMLIQSGAKPAWVYGLCAGLCYGTAALLSVSPAANGRAQSTGVSTFAGVGAGAGSQAGSAARTPLHTAVVHISVQDADNVDVEPTAPPHATDDARA